MKLWQCVASVGPSLGDVKLGVSECGHQPALLFFSEVVDDNDIVWQVWQVMAVCE